MSRDRNTHMLALADASYIPKFLLPMPHHLQYLILTDDDLRLPLYRLLLPTLGDVWCRSMILWREIRRGEIYFEDDDDIDSMLRATIRMHFLYSVWWRLSLVMLLVLGMLWLCLRFS
ncbi:hypothetical protein CC86DRAFT_368533 [Ophiobolus disseminans]|uniref:Uncharacterized protein n=1 Tax=Ophiobolus disseminans TaxID=1469910 RepID=A0A6A7AA93_9PLEO|nr:hypothetical protein CC86DRAFT_368533 [Ophiobolus disseminans]